MRTWPTPDVPPLPRTGAPAPVLVHDSTTQSLVEAAPGATATLYACGITPYDATHLGHANTYLAFDLLQRAWLDAGKTVVYTSNVTDVDDPLLERATATGVDWRELAREQTELYRTDMTALRMLPPATWTGAVESIPAVVEAVTALLDAGAAYRVDADVYADLSADPGFGRVAGLDDATMRALFAERGGDPDRPGKKHPLDPALWRGEQPGEPSWDGGKLGPGRPGWHIECAVIARDGLGLPFDVQGGGADLLFPHHEMSTSHARLLAGGAARVHVHAGLLAYDGHKMSKSRGNLVFVSRLLAAGTDPMTVRLALLAHHYREEWEWTDVELRTAQRRLDTWTSAILSTHDDGEPADTVLDAVRAALAADLDAPAALAAVDRWAANPGGDAGVVVATVDALLGIEL
ncbi:cysteine/1-D-myo-inosityl 2-amino-2-deoxy-alpha- D-glucopyranoside ligase [Xylanimonas cellulosilytica DSM 15894]|uniref:L-cysteine:1D-myo-inositol 2-amino-2-deoxy-alpha-D-glucopyranoside ligase n=1 Tax=Xylanimonas cellulosilytica (strain DSM 15894 / JCM 12276 / CECT 5975 / KCTC 9989 / LMG 20990 / NBRC 107835 / XIL07) TaxID=446471 RepID=MSHC_XYLCX|nr:cysteine--1-D-myo-inosityl 2-amino-2-deoxy-alpha-D-glucopyranoside ligase [Xylanimonas cellulosilytica]D1BS17.1 RecName: Full=L-cysteine:1D-myo-inositol 2-amino-2-deoxy-alpha-D-glucopyranoside ligase; Short=L-Cys:GlcN-Ins ligase; AltName: Full=Mycothiol ligase; Short=MSH ligase [Xylanimonas cellulosilytica DSM 15894]ACZ30509.1 cysteine/1-D-myo-inosityl 2-amino-2-deoxy-alpha- D-glucopyranoside ligase [Xylanimonas cellulosilytica DSM 15894]